MKNSNNYLFALMLVSSVLFLANLEVLPVNIMEARNFVTAREMITDGNWLLTTMNAEPRYEKPPLPTWLTAFSALAFGLDNLFALRLPAAILGLIAVLFSYLLLLRISGNSFYSFVSGLMMATSFYVLNASRDANWDIFTHGFMMASIYFIYELFSSNSNLYRNAFLSGLFLSFSFLSKGPVSLYAIFLPFLIAYFVVYKINQPKTKILAFCLMPFVAVVFSGLWYLYIFINDPIYAAKITSKETTNWVSYELRPFYYYWSFFTQSGVWTIIAFVSLLYPYLKNKVSNSKMYLFTLVWTLSSLILLSAIPEKKQRYLLPVIILLAMNSGFYMEYMMNKFQTLKNKFEVFPVYFNFSLIALIGFAFPIAGCIFLQGKLDGKYLVFFVLLSISLVAFGFAILYFLKQKNITKVFFLSIGLLLSVVVFGMPLAKIVFYNPNYKSMKELRVWEEKNNLMAYEFGGSAPEMIWDFGKPIPSLHKNGIFHLSKEKNFGLLVHEDDSVNFKKMLSDYSFKKVARYDINPSAPEYRDYKNRLWRDFYLLEKKN